MDSGRYFIEVTVKWFVTTVSLAVVCLSYLGYSNAQKQSTFVEKMAAARSEMAARQTNLITVVQQFPPAPSHLYLVWENPNPTNMWPRLWIEIQSTTNLITGTWTTKWWHTATSNYVLFYPTNRQEFFKARYAEVYVGLGTNYSEWSYK